MDFENNRPQNTHISENIKQVFQHLKSFKKSNILDSNFCASSTCKVGNMHDR